jgi:hypothetical protein
VGVTHRDYKNKIYCENYAIQKIIDRGPRTTKWAPRGPLGGRKARLMVGQPTTSSSLVSLRPRSDLSLIYFNYIYIVFCFDPN